jgi:D-inositol-3-phosphate glycosyltransferase
MRGLGRASAAVRRRILATWRVWQKGDAHMAMHRSDAAEDSEPWLPVPFAMIDWPPAGSPVSSEVIHVSGWAATPAGPCSRVELSANGQPLGRARLGRMRPDAAAATGLPSALLSGFELSVQLAELREPAAELEIDGVAVGLDGMSVPIPPLRLSVAIARDANGSSPLISAPRILRARPGQTSALRLLVMTHELGYGGAQLVLVELLRQFAAQERIEGLVVALRDGPTRRSLEEVGFDVHATAHFPIDSPVEYENRLEELAGYLAPRGFDAALVNTMVAFPGGGVCAKLGLPTVWAIHESYTLPAFWGNFDGRLHPRVRQWAEEALRMAALVGFTADATRALYEPYIPDVECRTLPYGIDVDALDRWQAGWDRAEARRRQEIPEDACVLLCMGTIEPRKAQTQLIYAFAQIAARHPHALLLIVGSRDDEYSRAAREAVIVHGLERRVRIQPIVEDTRPFYGIADVLVSAADIESTPRSMLEAMAFRLPIVAANVFGVPELIDNGRTGWLFDARDVGVLANALDEVLSLPPAVRGQVAERARAVLVSEYRSDVCSREWLQALRDAAVSPRPRPRAGSAAA